MKVTPVVSFVVLAFFSTNSFGQTVRESIQAHYDEISRLTTKRDKDKLSKVMLQSMTSNFVMVDTMKNTYEGAIVANTTAKQLDSVVKFLSNSNKIVGVKVQGINLVCTVKTTYGVLSKGSVNAKNLDTVHGVSISQDIWTKTLVGWKLMKSTTIKETLTLNGKPASPKF